MKKISLVIALLLSCTNSDRATSTLDAQGFRNITITGWSSHCAESDDTCTGFEATNTAGRIVSGSVGCGRSLGGCGGKGCTIRFD